MLHCSQGDRSIFIVGSVLGICAGWLDLKVGDLLFTALFVLASTMLLGAVRPQRPWRWTLLVAVFVPTVQLLAYLFMTQKPLSGADLRIVPRVFDWDRRSVRRIGGAKHGQQYPGGEVVREEVASNVSPAMR